VRLIGAAILAALVAAAGTARAEERVYTGLVGGGMTLQLDSDAVSFAPNLLFKSVYGFTDRLNWDGPLLIDLGDRSAITGGTGLEYVYHGTNHWRLNVGAGGMLRLPFDPSGTLRAGPYAETAVRWLVWWGVGFSLELHVAYSVEIGHPTGNPGELDITPGLAMYQEFW
jgi:hypothetical protein